MPSDFKPVILTWCLRLGEIGVESSRGVGLILGHFPINYLTRLREMATPELTSILVTISYRQESNHKTFYSGTFPFNLIGIRLRKVPV